MVLKIGGISMNALRIIDLHNEDMKELYDITLPILKRWTI